MRPLLLAALALTPACAAGKLTLGDIETEEDIAEACEEHEPLSVTLEVLFEAQTEACPWGEGDNLPEMENGVFTARVEQTEALEMPASAVICDMTFDFAGLVPGEIQVMVYDDHFFFTFNGIVLAASYGPSVEAMAADEDLRFYDWGDVAGVNYHEVADFDPYCLGEAGGEADCDIPDTEVEGPISLSYGEDIVNRLSLSAIEDERYDFAFVATGDDNPDTDCMHEAFGFTVEVPYLRL